MSSASTGLHAPVGVPVSVRRQAVLIGRAGERRLLDQLLENGRRGQSEVLVLRGEAGIGKSALLDYCARQAADFRVAEVAGVEAEMELPFAAIHQLCSPLLDWLEALPEPQQRALGVALGLSSGAAPDRFLVALAVLGLLSAAARERPVLCLIDDAQWLDIASSQVLGFVARRLCTDSVGIVFAARGPGTGKRGLVGLPELTLAGLDEHDAHALLARVVPGRLDERIRDRIVAETGGNPLALLELPRDMSAAELAGGFELPSAGDLQGQIEDHFLQQVSALPEATRLLLLIAAADPAVDPVLVWSAAQELGIGSGALAPAVEAQLMDIGEQVRFRHPLVRTAAYRAASPLARQQVHRALAELTDPVRDPDRRAWHRALAASGLDEDVAAALERSAGRAQARGGLAAAAAFLERAADLTPDIELCVGRALGAAEAKYRCGEAESALRLIGLVDAGPVNALQRARAHLLHGKVVFSSRRRADAPPLLLSSARELEALDPQLSRDTYLSALSTALLVGRLAGEVGVSEVARAAFAAPVAPPASTRPQDLLLEGLALTIGGGPAAGAPALRAAVKAFRTTELPVAEALRSLWPATHAAHDLWDDESWDELSARQLRLARETGALTLLPIVLRARISFHLVAGELAAATSLSDELAAVTEATGGGQPKCRALALAAFRGREAEVTGLVHAACSELVERGDGMGLTFVEHAEAILYSGLGRYREGCAAAGLGAAHPEELAVSAWSLPYLVEAAVRSDRRALADDAMRRLVTITEPSGTDWALGVEARCRALLADGKAAEGHFRDAIEHLERTRLGAEQARAHLLYGEWLRREGRRIDARERLRSAHEMFTDMGMEAFADRARRERLATGETLRRRHGAGRDELTPQESQIAQLAREGLTNAEIGGQLFLSPRTVEWHLKKIFTKLRITSRRGLLDALPGRERQATIA